MAQETLIEAWRNRHKLSDPTGRLPWLAAIARHVARWRPARAGAPSDQKVCGGCARLRSAFPGPYPQRFPAAQKAGRSSAPARRVQSHLSSDQMEPVLVPPICSFCVDARRFSSFFFTIAAGWQNLTKCFSDKKRRSCVSLHGTIWASPQYLGRDLPCGTFLCGGAACRAHGRSFSPVIQLASSPPAKPRSSHSLIHYQAAPRRNDARGG